MQTHSYIDHCSDSYFTFSISKRLTGNQFNHLSAFWATISVDYSFPCLYFPYLISFNIHYCFPYPTRPKYFIPFVLQSSLSPLLQHRNIQNEVCIPTNVQVIYSRLILKIKFLCFIKASPAIFYNLSLIHI